MTKANINRIMDNIFFLRDIENPLFPEGCTRHSFSPQDMMAREYILKQCEKLELEISVDGVGNIRARYLPEGISPHLKPVFIGSHIDTVTNGGAYDGVVGVMCSLEVINVIKENNISIKKPIELIIFSEEEGSNFAGTLLGSKALIGKLTTEDLKIIKNDNGESAYTIIKQAGYDPNNLKKHVVKPGDISAMIEMHVEQGDSLEQENCQVGIVQAIAGQRTYKIVITGTSNHAGAAQMVSRHDPLVGASQVIQGLQKAALNYSDKTAVATVGKIFCFPNSTNAIAKTVEFYADIRDVKEEGIINLSNKLEELTADACKEYGLSYEIELVAESDIVHLDAGIIETITEAAKNQGTKYMLTNSGAVHDSVMLADIGPVGMIFVPSHNGLSHCPEEFTKEEDIETGCNVLIEAVLKLLM